MFCLIYLPFALVLLIVKLVLKVPTKDNPNNFLPYKEKCLCDQLNFLK